MPTTLGEAITDLRSRLNETIPNYYANSDLTNWLNEGCRDMARKCRCLWSQTSVSVTAGQQTFDAPENLVAIHRVEFNPTGSDQTYPLEFRNYNEMDALWGTWHTIQQYAPSIYTTWGEPPNMVITVYPLPSQDGSMNVFWFRTATYASEDDDNLDVPEGWGDAAIEYALFTCLYKALDPRWKDIKAHYEEKIVDLSAQAAQYSTAVGSISPASNFSTYYPWLGGNWDW